MPAKELYAANALASLHNGIAARLRRGSFAAKKICRSEVTYALHYRLLQRCMSSEDPCDIRILPHSVCLYFNNIHSQNVEKTPEKKAKRQIFANMTTPYNPTLKRYDFSSLGFLLRSASSGAVLMPPKKSSVHCLSR